MSEIEECRNLLHLARSRNESLQSFVLTESQARRLADEVGSTPGLCKADGTPATKDDVWFSLVTGETLLFGLSVRVS